MTRVLRAQVGLRRSLLDGLLLLMLRGCVLPVLTHLEVWLAHADLSLVRHAMGGLLGVAAPPFSEAFGGRLLAMLTHERTLEAHRGGEHAKVLEGYTHVVRQGVAAAADDDPMDD